MESFNNGYFRGSKFKIVGSSRIFTSCFMSFSTAWVVFI